MICAIGVDGDFTFHEFLRECSRRKASVRPINLRALVLFGDWMIDVTKSDGCNLYFPDTKMVLNPHDGFFFRPFSPSAVDVPRNHFLRWENLIQGLSSWLLYHQVKIVNCPRSVDFNPIKSLHEHLLRKLGFQIPTSITTSDPSRLLHFCKRHRSIIKSHCGVRANARLVGPREIYQYDLKRGPLHLQEYIAGYDVRAHTVGERVFSTKIASDQVDYRTDASASVYSVFELGDLFNKSLVSATRQIGLYLAGWDFKIDHNEVIWTLEANSMPGYAGYDKIHKGQTSEAIIEYLSKESQTT